MPNHSRDAFQVARIIGTDPVESRPDLVGTIQHLSAAETTDKRRHPRDIGHQNRQAHLQVRLNLPRVCIMRMHMRGGVVQRHTDMTALRNFPEFRVRGKAIGKINSVR